MRDIEALEFQIDRFVYNLNIREHNILKNNLIDMLKKYEDIPYQIIFDVFEYVVRIKKTGAIRVGYYDKVIQSDLEFSKGNELELKRYVHNRANQYRDKNRYFKSLQNQIKQLELKVRELEVQLLRNQNEMKDYHDYLDQLVVKKHKS